MGNKDKKTLWAERIQESESFEGSNHRYCRSKGYPDSTFRYWKSRLKAKKTPSVEAPVVDTPFLKVEIAKESYPLPDARWVAEIIFHLSRGLQ